MEYSLSQYLRKYGDFEFWTFLLASCFLTLDCLRIFWESYLCFYVFGRAEVVKAEMLFAQKYLSLWCSARIPLVWPATNCLKTSSVVPAQFELACFKPTCKLQNVFCLNIAKRHGFFSGWFEGISWKTDLNQSGTTVWFMAGNGQSLAEPVCKFHFLFCYIFKETTVVPIWFQPVFFLLIPSIVGGLSWRCFSSPVQLWWSLGTSRFKSQAKTTLKLWVRGKEKIQSLAKKTDLAQI